MGNMLRKTQTTCSRAHTRTRIESLLTDSVILATVVAQLLLGLCVGSSLLGVGGSVGFVVGVEESVVQVLELFQNCKL